MGQQPFWGWDLSNNKLTGPLPGCLNTSKRGEWELLMCVRKPNPRCLFSNLNVPLRSLDDNQLTGPLPTWIGDKTWWYRPEDGQILQSVVSFKRNKFCGKVPPAFCELEEYVSRMWASPFSTPLICFYLENLYTY